MHHVKIKAWRFKGGVAYNFVNRRINEYSPQSLNLGSSQRRPESPNLFL